MHPQTALAQDSRGILNPGLMATRVAFDRFDAPEALVGLVDWFWSVAWDLPAGTSHRQQVLSHPGVNISVGRAPQDGLDPGPIPFPLAARLNGVHTGLSIRVLRDNGWNVAAKTTVGGLGAFTPRTVSKYTDRVLPVHEVLHVDADLAEGVAQHPSPQAKAQALGVALTAVIERVDPARVSTAREVAAIGRHAESDRSIRTTTDLAAAAGVAVRTLQRLFVDFVGASPSWVIRRYRLIDAADRARAGASIRWADVAAELGYADQAHLSRDFTATIGTPPRSYLRSLAQA